jgi:hypothetical protein
MTRKTVPAELVFVERNFSGRGLPGWDGHLLNDRAIDRKTGLRRHAFIARINYAKPYGSLDRYGQDAAVIGQVGEFKVYEGYPYQTVRQARSKYARRYDSFPTLAEAQASLIRWAARNFKVVVDLEPVR